MLLATLLVSVPLVHRVTGYATSFCILQSRSRALPVSSDMKAVAAVAAWLQAKVAVEIPQWLFQRLAEESAGLSQAAEAPAEGQGHGDRSPCACELLALRGAAEAELAMAAQKGMHAQPGNLPAAMVDVACDLQDGHPTVICRASCCTRPPLFPFSRHTLCDSRIANWLAGHGKL